MLNTLRAASSLCFILLLGSACASYTETTKEIRSDFQNENYQQALTKLDKSEIKDQKRNRLLYSLERSSILDRLGRREDGRKTLLKADEQVDELYRSSLSGDAASFLYNDSASDYQGEDYEKVAIHTQLALSFLEDKDLSAAGVEARKINTRLTEINNFYDNHKNKYAEDAFARFLAALVYEARGDWDNAIVDYKAALKLYRGPYTEYFQTAVPDELVYSLYGVLERRGRRDDMQALKKEFPDLLKKPYPQDQGSIVVIHEVDYITPKTTEEFVWPVGDDIMRFSFPTIRPRYHGWWGKTGLIIDNGRFQEGSLVQNMDPIAKQTLEDRRLRLMAKQGARLILKSQLRQQAERNFGLLGYIGASIYNVVTETADTRSWTLLPAGYFISRIPLPAGKHKLQINTNGRVSQLETVQIENNKIVFFRDRA